MKRLALLCCYAIWATAQRQWVRGEARINAAAVVLPPQLLWPWVADDDIEGLCATASGRGADAAAAAPNCYDMKEGIQNTHPLVIAPLAFAAKEANATQHAVPAVLSLQPVDGRGRACRPPAHLDVLVQPAPEDFATPRVLIAWPPLGYVQHHNASIEIFIHVAGEVPDAAVIKVEFEGGTQPPTQIGVDMMSMVLTRVEPATHVLGFTVGLFDAYYLPGNAEGWTTIGPKTQLSFDAVLSDEEIVQNRVPGPPLSTYIPDVPELPELINILIVGSMKYDGQKNIYVQQLTHLDRSRFNFTYASFMGDEDRATFTKLPRILTELDVPPAWRPIPPISGTEAEERHPDLGALVDRLDGSTDGLNHYLLESLALAHDRPEDCTPNFAKRTWLHLVQNLRHLNPDILVFANARDPSDLILAKAARLAVPSAKLVMELPNLFPQLYDLDLIIAPSHYAALHHSVQSAVARLPPARQPRVAVVTPGVDAAIYGNVQEAACPHECSLNRSSWPQNWERVDAPGCAASCEIVGFLARLSPEKSPGLLVHAASIILAQRPLARVVFVGDGAARSQCELLTRAYGLEHRVSFVGAVYGAEKVASYYASFDLIVQPALRAWSETFCIANLEAMASARPVVSFGVGGVGEYFVAAPTQDQCLKDAAHRGCAGDANGVAVHSATPEALAGAVLELLADAGGRDALGGNARRAAAGAFSIEGFVAKYAVLYTRLHRGEDLSDLPFVIS